MSSDYKLDSAEEACRLEEQSSTDNYSLKNEILLAQVEINEGDFVLDAGCGTGLLSRGIIDLYPDRCFEIHAIDVTESLLDFARQQSSKKSDYQNRIEYRRQDICNLKIQNFYHKIFSRFVFQHITTRTSQLDAAKSLYDALAPGGTLLVIDSYGFFSHMDTKNEWLLNTIQNVEENIPIDMNIGIKLRGLFLDVGVEESEIKVFIDNFKFQTPRERELEAHLWQQRFSNAKTILNLALGEEVAIKFGEEYVKEFLNPRTIIHAQKFLIKIDKKLRRT
jgi:SAM-dependent methyltransferase